MKIDLPHQQKGAAAIEFALVFVIFFAVLYGVLSYSLPLLLVQSFNHATAEAARRSVAVDPSAAGYDALVVQVAKDVLAEKLAWVPSGLVVKQEATYVAGLLTVKASIKASDLNAIMPVLKLGTITVPSLPATLEATSSLKF
ncbi:MAG: TadE/TadG family type IV pilus assembly protein [Pseudomonadota bacterium]